MNLLTMEDEKFKTVNIQGQYKFTIRYVTPMDIVLITQRRMKLQNGCSMNTMTQDEFDYFENIAMVDICVTEMPKGFKEGESCVNWPDQELINSVAYEIKKHTSYIEEALKKK